jgi:uncharacterized protein (TIGR02246 family)
MRTGKRLALAVGLAAILAAAGFVALRTIPAGAEEPKAEEKAVDKDRRAAFIAAYEKGDAKAIAAFWAPDATYVEDDGREHKGRAAIQQMYEKVFAENKGAKLAIHVTSIKQLTPDVVLEDGITEVTPAGGGFPVAERFSAVLVKKDGEWYIQSIHEAEIQPPSANAEHLEDIQWLIGDWAGENEKGESGSASYDWAENNNFIVSTFATTLDGVPVTGGTQWIGWDAVDKQIRSWSFYSGGGFGEAVWTRDGNKWTLKTTARTAAGKKVTATNVVTKTDNDHLTWQVTKLTVDGETLPDLKPVKMKRVKQATP